ncbi:hypothetical protein TcasGA2_TC032006 [Tribolium castaneum]|nr:hypothetical protein TcasGA2_TC032006 [Tribolium castaneum]
MNFPLFLLVFCLAKDGDAGGSIPGIELSMPPSHIALSGDLHIQITSSSFPPLMLQLSRLEGNIAQPLTTFPVLPEARALSLNTTIVKIPCGYFSKGGQYYILIKKQPIGGSNSTLVGDDDSVITRSLDVRWPMPQLSVTPEHIQTYPETPVMAILEFPEVVCPPVTDSPISAIPEFWLELHYCGHSLLTCDNDDNRQNNSNVQVLDQVRGFGGRRVFTLRCELFGLAGFYALFLRPTATTQLLPHTAAYVKADWSEQFVFNVHARSILPCDGHSGIKVLFQYPSCILASGDRVRVFARLRANVASLAPPTSLEYVAEKRVIRGQHSLHFDCDLFTERYVEYCFVYVSQAINEAVADVRMDCVPTLPVTENESGGWGPWSPWTPCSSTCIGGTRSRYRFCDSPPPRYGAKFCELCYINYNMAKGKKKGKKKKKAPKIDPNALTEVDKTFYELTITDLNRKLARLRSLTTELEEKNEQLQTDLSKLDEDRNDIIIYLKRMLQERSDEIAELQERLRALEETRQDETEQYEAKITDLENEYKQMHEQLTSEIKLLEGKLNSLEEFRIQRDELMKKFEDQEIAMEEQEKRHKNELYDIERKFIIGKDKLKKDMEARLLQLSSEFQEATELRIAATTHRVIRENIAINNELDAMLITHQKLHSDNAKMKDRDRTLRQETELHEAEKKKALNKVRVQLKLIDRLTTEHEDMKQKLTKYETTEQEMHQTSEELQKTKQDVLCLNHKIKLLEQNIHALKCRESSLKTELSNLDFDNDRLTTVLAQAVLSIKEVLELQSRMSDEALKASKRENLLTQLFVLLSEAETKKGRKASLDTIGSLSATYERGDLGFVPKPLTRRSTLSTLRDIQAQTGPSFDEFLAIGKEEDLEQQETSLVSSEEESKGSEGTLVEEESDVFFDEEEEAADESMLEYDDVELLDEEDEEIKAAREVAATKSANELIVERALSSAAIAKKLSGIGSKEKSRSRISFKASKEKGVGQSSKEEVAEKKSQEKELGKASREGMSTDKLKRVSIGETTEMVIPGETAAPLPKNGDKSAETSTSEPST